MALVSAASVREVRSRADVVQVVGEFVNLKRAGTRFKGLCPFHNEKTPSFTVNQEQGFFHCFGCGEHGDAIGFLQKHNGLTFVEAVEQLASQVGVELRYEGGELRSAKDSLGARPRTAKNAGDAGCNPMGDAAVRNSVEGCSSKCANLALH